MRPSTLFLFLTGVSDQKHSHPLAPDRLIYTQRKRKSKGKAAAGTLTGTEMADRKSERVRKRGCVAVEVESIQTEYAETENTTGTRDGCYVHVPPSSTASA